jgi:primosomal protein N' (replication factor Y) (superfamily II helicase)
MPIPETSLPGEAGAPERRIKVLLPLPLPQAYDYAASQITPAPGTFLHVPIAGRDAIGVVWDGAPDETLPAARLKLAGAALSTPPLPEVSRRFVEWVADYTMAPLGAVLRMAMSVPAALEPPRGEARLAAAPALPAGLKRTQARRRVLEFLRDGHQLPAVELARAAAVGPSVVRQLLKSGALIENIVVPRPEVDAVDPDLCGPTLSGDQAAAAEELKQRMRAGTYSVTVLDGVTGSGKTEVYFETIAEALRLGRQALVLLPEIALSAQWLDRFRARFGGRPVVWHSELTGRERRRAWRAVAAGSARIVVGARSALFLPFPALGLIVVDEEHEQAYKQEDGVAYQARDMAVVRGHLGQHPVVLVSATPSLETIVNVRSGRYRGLPLPDRHGGAKMPTIELIDMRRDGPKGARWLSPPLAEALTDTIGRGEQALLFLNRRGYAPLTLCRSCGHRMNCPNCTTWLVEHRLAGRLSCHHCGHSITIPPACPACASAGSLVACGPGVERLAEEARALLPGVRLALMTSDTLAGPRAATILIEQIANREIDLIVGTQVVAKGHHFPSLTLVGVVDADLGLSGGDLRAGERTAQLLFQVSGRAGRAEQPGRVLLQTYMPENPLMQALGRGELASFMALEIDERQRAGLPPFGRLAAIILSGRDPATVDRAAARLARTAPHSQGFEVLGPAPAPLAVLRGQHRRRFLIRAARGRRIQAPIAEWLQRAGRLGGVRLQVDIDPYSFL